MLDDTVKWLWVQHGDTAVTAGELRLGRFGLPLLSAASDRATTLVTLPDGRRLEAIRLDTLDPSRLNGAVHPGFYSAAEGVYYYRMTFADLIARNYSDKALSAGVRSILKEWGYIR